MASGSVATISSVFTGTSVDFTGGTELSGRSDAMVATRSGLSTSSFFADGSTSIASACSPTGSFAVDFSIASDSFLTINGAGSSVLISLPTVFDSSCDPSCFSFSSPFPSSPSGIPALAVVAICSSSFVWSFGAAGGAIGGATTSSTGASSVSIGTFSCAGCSLSSLSTFFSDTGAGATAEEIPLETPDTASGPVSIATASTGGLGSSGGAGGLV
mmetsp:Transcript_13786/g.19916  ORF Transcript_13786/g.19916 Transcript_13786/m.19916 type:complete len:215 (-) Transcript_13786:1745-2389(-)